MANLDKVLEEFLCKSYSKLIYHEEKILKKLGDITLKELRTLDIISNCCRGDNNTSTIIARLLGITVSTLTTNIDRLIKKGLVIKDKKESDLRTSWISLTSKGYRLLSEYNEEHNKLVIDGLNKLTDKEKATLVSLVSKLEI